MRTAISPHERLTATLRFLATGQDLEFTTIISKQALSEIIPETPMDVSGLLATCFPNTRNSSSACNESNFFPTEAITSVVPSSF
ncbi:hypothetical protein NQ317_012429 [Molorchus minor]|uniref:Uncharacterized protein n=1 Tax=Molorchus minor TaxID=1323400 RepID=A0ABQ9JAE3_9CUCU|nr:hypothetical protein NQ317_012429 [Molorchus minor]